MAGRGPRCARRTPGDADGDGIPDREDALLFTPNEPIRFTLRGPPLNAESDGKPPPLKAGAKVWKFHFRGRGTPAAAGFRSDHGNAFSRERGFGWARDLSANARKRGVLDDPLRDQFLFTRGRDRWECEFENGRYRVTVCAGDAAHPQRAQRIRVEGKPVLDDCSTAAGRFAEGSQTVQVEDGRLTVDLGSGQARSNTCWNWLLVERMPEAK